MVEGSGETKGVGSEKNGVAAENVKIEPVGKDVIRPSSDIAAGGSEIPEENKIKTEVNIIRKTESKDSESNPKKKRRIIDDDDESNDQTNRLGKSKSSFAVETDDSVKDEKEGNSKSINRLSPRTRNTSSTKKRPSIHDSDEDESKERTQPRSRSPRISTTGRDAANVSAIPKKAPRKTSDTEETSKKTSLIANMSVPPPQPKTSSSGSKTAQNKGSSSPKKDEGDAKSKHVKAENSSANTKAAKGENSTIGGKPVDNKAKPAKTDAAEKERKLQNFLANKAKLTSTQQQQNGSGSIKFAESVVIQDLQDVCGRCAADPKFRLPPPTSNARVDLAGSFLDDDQYDFFDTNERGEIYLMPRPPIFPEEFPKGTKEPDLSWWGILDPVLGDGKFKGSSHSPTPMDVNQPAPNLQSPSTYSSTGRQAEPRTNRGPDERWRGPPPPGWNGPGKPPRGSGQPRQENLQRSRR